MLGLSHANGVAGYQDVFVEFEGGFNAEEVERQVVESLGLEFGKGVGIGLSRWGKVEVNALLVECL